MGYAERSYSYRFGDSSGGGGGGFGRLFGSITPWVRRLLIANAAIWLLMFVGLLPRRWAIESFGFSPEGFLTRPWSPLTYMFVHGGFWHVFWNMVILFFFGPHLERAWGGRGFLKFYVVAGLGGALASVLFLPTEAVQPDTLLVGASAAIYGVMLAFAFLWPDTKVYLWFVLPIRAKWLMGVLVLITFVSTSVVVAGGGGNVAHWAHLGGLVTGFAYLKWGRELSRVIDPVLDGVAGLFAGEGGSARSGRRGGDGEPRVGRRRRREGSGGGRQGAERSTPAGRTVPFGHGGEEDEPTSEEMLDEVDRILDKIREEGLESLSREEREFLDEMSRRYRG